MNDPNIKRFGYVDYLKIGVLGFALTALWSSLHSIILPLRLLDYVAESQKNTYLGLLTFAGLILAMITQPIAGSMSDRSSLSWGRRRPFVLLGALLAVVLLPGIGLADSYAVVFIVYCALQISCNIAQAPYQALIPDLIPPNRRGLASGVKSAVEILGGVALVRLTAYFMGHYFEGGGESWLWLALGVLVAVLLTAAAITVLTVKEQPGNSASGLPFVNPYKSFKIDVRENHNFIWFLVSRALIGVPGVVLQIFASYYLMDVIGIDNPASAAGNLLVVIGVCLLLTVYPAGRLSDKVGRKPIVIASGLLGAVGIVCLFFSQTYLHVMLSGAVLGISNGAMLSSTWAMATDLAVKGEEARYLGLTNLAMCGGSAMARLVGPVIDFFNRFSAGLGYQVMLLICFISFVVGALLIIKIKPQGFSTLKEQNKSG
ncbi:MAG: MFS transporter [Dehalococcoidales bacterium]|nr:MFS transporter [Dehalococcoidales bacterium]